MLAWNRFPWLKEDLPSDSDAGKTFNQISDILVENNEILNTSSLFKVEPKDCNFGINCEMLPGGVGNDSCALV